MQRLDDRESTGIPTGDPTWWTAEVSRKPEFHDFRKTLQHHDNLIWIILTFLAN
jgi:hypothetical protein